MSEAHWNHSHLCGCGMEWRHDIRSPNYKEAHECPKCGTYQNLVHEWASKEEEAIWNFDSMGDPDPRGSLEEFLREMTLDDLLFRMMVVRLTAEVDK